MEHPDKNVVLYFTPSLPCDKCARATNVGYFTQWNAGMQVECWEHGYVDFVAREERPTQYEITEKYNSIVRFVIGKKDGYGSCIVIGAFPLDSVPGYTEQSEREYFDSDEEYIQQATGMEPIAHLVRYEDEEGSTTEFYAVWSIIWHEFTLYGDNNSRESE